MFNKIFIILFYSWTLDLVLSLRNCDVSEPCTFLEECKFLYDQTINKKSIRDPIYSEIISRHCEFVGLSTKVCCPTIGNRDGITSVSNHPNLRLLPADCGNELNNKLAGGEKVPLYEFTWMVLLSYRLTKDNNVITGCGGTLISDRYVLTAGHCVANLLERTLDQVIIGESNLDTDPDCIKSKILPSCRAAVYRAEVEEVKIHPQYSSLTFANDIALIRLTKPVPSIQRVDNICLPTTSDAINADFLNQNGTIAGWGLTEYQQSSSSLLRANLKIISNVECGKSLNASAPGGIIDTHICAKGFNGTSSCKGDSGGPLKMALSLPGKGRRLIQFGIVSFGVERCGNQYPAVFTRVTEYMDWILNQLRE